MSVRYLSRKTGIAISTINSFRNEATERIDRATTETLCSYLDISFDELWEILEN